MQFLGTWFWRLIPANPMVIRIVQGGSRRTRHLWIRLGYLGFLIALILLSLLASGGAAGTMDLSDLAKAGSNIFAWVAYGQVILVCFFAPLFMAGAIGSEQQGETLDILMTTPLSNLQIVFGSLLGRLFFVLALLFSGLPLFSILLVFGGVPVNSVFVAFGTAGFTALFVGSVAVTLSVFRIGGRKAVFTFVIAIVTYLLAAYVLDVAILRQFGTAGESTWLTPLHPLLVLEASVNSANYAPPARETLTNMPSFLAYYKSQPFAMFSILSLVTSVLMLLACALVIRRWTQGESRWIGLIKFFLLQSSREKTRDGREVWHNPIAWREANTRGNAATGLILRYGFVAFMLLLSVAWLLVYHFDAMPQALGQPQKVFHVGLLTLLLGEIAVVTLIALYMSAGCVSREREDGTLDLILTTPVTPKQYIWGKLRGLVSFLSLLIALPVMTLLIAGLYSLFGDSVLNIDQATYRHTSFSNNSQITIDNVLLVTPDMAIYLLFMLGPFVAMCVATGMSWSLKAKGVLGAVIPSVLIIVILAGVVGLCGYGAVSNIPLVGPVLNAFSPATNVFMLVDPWTNVSGFAEQPIPGRVSIAIASLIAAAGYSIAVYAMVVGMIKGFDQTVRKLSGTA